MVSFVLMSRRQADIGLEYATIDPMPVLSGPTWRTDLGVQPPRRKENAAAQKKD